MSGNNMTVSQGGGTVAQCQPQKYIDGAKSAQDEKTKLEKNLSTARTDAESCKGVIAAVRRLVPSDFKTQCAFKEETVRSLEKQTKEAQRDIDANKKDEQVCREGGQPKETTKLFMQRFRREESARKNRPQIM